MEGFQVRWRVGMVQVRCKTPAEEREDHLEDRPEDRPEDPLEDHLDPLEPHEDWKMVVVRSRTEVLIFEGSLCEVHCPETSER